MSTAVKISDLSMYEYQNFKQGLYFCNPILRGCENAASVHGSEFLDSEMMTESIRVPAMKLLSHLLQAAGKERIAIENAHKKRLPATEIDGLSRVFTVFVGEHKVRNLWQDLDRVEDNFKKVYDEAAQERERTEPEFAADLIPYPSSTRISDIADVVCAYLDTFKMDSNYQQFKVDTRKNYLVGRSVALAIGFLISERGAANVSKESKIATSALFKYSTDTLENKNSYMLSSTASRLKIYFEKYTDYRLDDEKIEGKLEAYLADDTSKYLGDDLDEFIAQRTVKDIIINKKYPTNLNLDDATYNEMVEVIIEHSDFKESKVIADINKAIREKQESMNQHLKRDLEEEKTQVDHQDATIPIVGINTWATSVPKGGDAKLIDRGHNYLIPRPLDPESGNRLKGDHLYAIAVSGKHCDNPKFTEVISKYTMIVADVTESHVKEKMENGSKILVKYADKTFDIGFLFKDSKGKFIVNTYTEEGLEAQVIQDEINIENKKEVHMYTQILMEIESKVF